jgi:hypothetical protein
VKSSDWAAKNFGDDVETVLQAVPAALARAHELAVAAQQASGTTKRDPYGHTLKNTQHERLVAALGGLPGAECLKIKGASFQLVRFHRTRVVLYPWRYGNSPSDQRAEARMRLSGFRADLLGSGEEQSGQLDLEQAHLSERELAERLAEDAAVEQALRDLTQVVLIAYASSPRGLFSLGWGQAELLNDQGELRWRHWEPLAVPQASRQQTFGDGSSDGDAGPAVRPDLRVVGSAGPDTFASSPLDDDLGISARPHLEDAPTPEPTTEAPATGTGDDVNEP